MPALLLFLALAADEPTTAKGWLQLGAKQYQKRDYDAAAESFGRCLALDKDNGDALDGRGSAQFMRGKFAESVADFDRAIKLRPETANGHWRRGISLFYAGKFADGKRQFEGYEKVDTNDVENAVWHFLCSARLEKDLDKAREKGLLKIGKDRRVPMTEVYMLYKGKMKPDDVLAVAKDAKLGEAERDQALFYAHLYLGIYADIQGQAAKAKEHLSQAAGKYKIKHYMGEVARIHLETLKK